MNWSENWHKQMVLMWETTNCKWTVDLWWTAVVWGAAFILAIILELGGWRITV